MMRLNKEGRGRRGRQGGIRHLHLPLPTKPQLSPLQHLHLPPPPKPQLKPLQLQHCQSQLLHSCQGPRWLQVGATQLLSP